MTTISTVVSQCIGEMKILIFLLFLPISSRGIEVCDDILSSTTSTISSNELNLIDVVVASLGGPNIDGDLEDLSWIPSELDKTLYLYDRTNENSPYYINTTRGNECLTYMRYILDHYDNLPR